MVMRVIQTALAPLRRRVLLMVRLGVLRLVRSSLQTQELQVTAFDGEVLDRVKHLLPYGVNVHPKPGAEVLLVFPGGNTSMPVAIAVGGRDHRATDLAEGEVEIYDDQGQRVVLRRDGIELHSPFNVLMKTDGILRLDADGVEIHGRTYVQMDVAGKGERETHVGGTDYRTDTWTTGATAVPGTEYGLDQPDIPSDHPEAL